MLIKRERDEDEEEKKVNIIIKIKYATIEKEKTTCSMESLLFFNPYSQSPN